VFTTYSFTDLLFIDPVKEQQSKKCCGSLVLVRSGQKMILQLFEGGSPTEAKTNEPSDQLYLDDLTTEEQSLCYRIADVL